MTFKNTTLLGFLCIIGLAAPIAGQAFAHDLDRPHRHTTRAEIEKRKQERIDRLTARKAAAAEETTAADNGFTPPPEDHTDDHAHDDAGFDVDENGERNLANGRHEKPKERRARRKEEAKALRDNRRENQDRKVKEARRYREAAQQRRDNR